MEVIYEVKTKHSDEMLKKYVKFQYNVLMPTKRFQSILTILVLAAVAVFMPGNFWKLILIVFTVIMILNVLTESMREVGGLKRSDPSYINQSVITYRFYQDRAEMESPEVKEKITFTYEDIAEIYRDETFYYIRIPSKGIHMFPRADITVGDSERFGEFLRSRTSLALQWADLNIKQRIAVMQKRKSEYDKDRKAAKKGKKL